MTQAPNDRNIFEQLGFSSDEARDLAIRSILMGAVRRIIRHRSLTPAAAAEHFGTRAWRIREVMAGQIGEITGDELVAMLACAGVPVLHRPEPDSEVVARARADGIDIERLEALLRLTPDERLRLNDAEVRLAYLAVARIPGAHGDVTFIAGTRVPLTSLLDARGSGATLHAFLTLHPAIDAWKAQVLWRCEQGMLARLVERGPP